MVTDFTLPLDAFVRSVCINRVTPHTLFLGAGTSIQAGIPDADTCVWEWKRDIYLTNHTGSNNHLRTVARMETREIIQQWFDVQGAYPPLDSREEYGFYVEYCYPIAEDRRQYFQRLAERARPTMGHYLLCLMAEAEIVKAVWTTNFDSLVLRAAGSSYLTPIEVTFETAQRVNRPTRRGELLYVALHGEYRYDALKNTPDEIKAQDQLLRDALIDQVQTNSLIVSGYSGRDSCVMDTLKAAYGQPGAGRLYWCGYLAETPAPHVIELLTLARANGHTAYYVPTLGFDDLLTRMALHCLNGELLERAYEACEISEDTPIETVTQKFQLE